MSPDLNIASEDVVFSIRAIWTTTDDLGLDHLPITFTIDGEQVTRKGKPLKWSYKKADWSGFKRKVTEVGDTPCGSLEQHNHSLTNIIIEAAKKHIPRGGNNKPRKPFSTSDCNEANRRCNRARRKVDRIGNKEDVDELQHARKDKRR